MKWLDGIIDSMDMSLSKLRQTVKDCMAKRKRASPRGEAGTSGFLSISDSDRRVPAELGQETQASSCVEEWHST